MHHAVFERRPLEALRDALLATDDLRAYRLNPELRTNLRMGVFYDRSHPLLMQAAAAALLSRRRPSNVLFCAPYAANVLGRCRSAGAPPWHAPYFVAFDALQIAATARGRGAGAGDGDLMRTRPFLVLSGSTLDGVRSPPA